MRLVLALSLTVALAAACGTSEEGQSSQSPAADTPAEERGDSAGSEDVELEGCALVTRDEVSKAVGSPVSEGETRGLVGCAWKLEPRGEIVLQVYAGSMFTAQTCDGQKYLITGRQEQVPGLGDSALWGSSGDLVVCTSKAVVKVDADNTPNPPEKDRETLIAVGRAALGRIQDAR